MNISRYFFASAALGAMLSTQIAVAETGTVKRVSCRDTSEMSLNNPVMAHANTSGEDMRFTVQVIRDGCRPKNSAGTYTLWVATFPGGANGEPLPRSGRYTHSLTKMVPSLRRAILQFHATNFSDRVSGTFDYTYTIE